MLVLIKFSVMEGLFLKKFVSSMSSMVALSKSSTKISLKISSALDDITPGSLYLNSMIFFFVYLYYFPSKGRVPTKIA
jgi:hypothetical protein